MNGCGWAGNLIPHIAINFDRISVDGRIQKKYRLRSINNGILFLANWLKIYTIYVLAS